MRTIQSLDPDFKNQIADQPGGERVSNCFLCGTCTAGCPISELNVEYNPRKIMSMILLGMKDEVLGSKELWQCQQCHVCVSHCPQDVRFADVMRVLRQLAVEEGYADAELVEKVKSLDEMLKRERIEKVRQMTEKP